MSDWTENNVNDIHHHSKAADTALSTYEKAMIKSVLEKKAAELAQAQHVNDSDPGTLSYCFRIFH